MNILVIGNESNLEECRTKFGSGYRYEHERILSVKTLPIDADVVFDFLEDAEQDRTFYNSCKAAVFFNTALTSLKALKSKHRLENAFPVFGFAGLPTFLNRELLEVSVENQNQLHLIAELCSRLDTKFQVVEDRVGLVTPRVICMIINEAYFAVQDGTATREAIDVAMKLGTHYPHGPFEWSRQIGVHHVYECLQAVYRDTKDERYIACSLMKQEYELI